jgi:hypothetical protein
MHCWDSQLVLTVWYKCALIFWRFLWYLHWLLLTLLPTFAEHCSHWPSITHILLQSVQQMNSSLHLDSRIRHGFPWDTTFFRR